MNPLRESGAAGASAATIGPVRIYLAGPLFTTAERAFNARLRDLLTAAGHQVWLPQDHEPHELTAAAIFRKDVEGIEWSEAIVANMDGPDPDSGTCWECGYAYGKKKIIVYRTDFRGIGEAGSPFNLMLSESANRVVVLPPFSSVEGVARELQLAVQECVERS
jgi:nucleoside 2-deoxyribosyltransferase